MTTTYAVETTTDQLTTRERDVLILIALGLSNEMVARSLYLSINSVKTYIRAAYRKIGAERRSQAVAWAFRNGLFDAVTSQEQTDRVAL